MSATTCNAGMLLPGDRIRYEPEPGAGYRIGIVEDVASDRSRWAEIELHDEDTGDAVTIRVPTYREHEVL
jgi:hypothetical protein